MSFLFVNAYQMYLFSCPGDENDPKTAKIQSHDEDHFTERKLQ